MALNFLPGVASASTIYKTSRNIFDLIKPKKVDTVNSANVLKISTPLSSINGTTLVSTPKPQAKQASGATNVSSVVKAPLPVVAQPVTKIAQPVTPQITQQETPISTQPQRPPTPPVSFIRESTEQISAPVQQTDEDILKNILTKQKTQLYPNLSASEIDFLVRQDINKSKALEEQKSTLLKDEAARQETARQLEEDRLNTQLKEETAKRAQDTAKLLEDYKIQLDKIYSPQIEKVQSLGRERQSTRERLAGSVGNLTSSVGVQAIDQIQQETAGAVGAIEAAKRLELLQKQAELEGADEEYLGNIGKELNIVKTRQKEITTGLESALAQLKFDAIEQGDFARQNLLQSALDNVSTKKAESYDKDLTALINDGFLYTTDENGVPQKIKDSEGNDIEIIGENYINIGGRAFDTKNGVFVENFETFGTPLSGVGTQVAPQAQLSREDERKVTKEVRATDEYKSLLKLNEVRKALSELENTWEESGKNISFVGEKAGKLSASYNNAITQLKEFYNLGALTGPDEGILKSIVPDPTSPTSYRFGNEAITNGIKASKERLEDTVAERGQTIISEFGDYNIPILEDLKTRLRPIEQEDLTDEQKQIFSDSGVDLSDPEQVEEAKRLFLDVGDKQSSNKNKEIKKIASAIGKYESGDNYSVLGKVIPSGIYKGDRALGRYQIMSKNLPSWSKEALGREVSKEEFLQNPQIQDKIAEFKIGQIYNNYGNVEDVASVWFTGQPASRSGGKKDLATGVGAESYIKSVKNIYNNINV